MGRPQPDSDAAGEEAPHHPSGPRADTSTHLVKVTPTPTPTRPRRRRARTAHSPAPNRRSSHGHSTPAVRYGTTPGRTPRAPIGAPPHHPRTSAARKASDRRAGPSSRPRDLRSHPRAEMLGENEEVGQLDRERPLGRACHRHPRPRSVLAELGSPFAAGANPYGVVAADFNRDDRPDIMAINGTSSNVSVLLRQPQGIRTGESLADQRRCRAQLRSGRRLQQRWLARRGGLGLFRLGRHVLLRKPGGGFGAEGSAYSVPGPGGIASGDFNGDHRPDLAVPRYGTGGGLVILLRKATNDGFTAAATVPLTGTNPRYVASADFNNDGRADLAISNIGSANVTILLGDGAGGFQQEVGSPISVGTAPIALTATDLNRDGLPDIAVVNSGTDSVSVLLRKPTGGFAPAAGSPFPVGDEPYGVVAADFNRDGLMDLATANHTSNNVTVLLRNANGSYSPDPSSPVPTGPGADQLVATDFNGDGKPDLAVTNDGASNVTVLLNTTPDPVTPISQPVVTTPPPVVVPVVKPPAPVIGARMVFGWTVYDKYLLLTSATVKGLPKGGATVRIICKACHLSQTVKVKKTSATLSKLRNKKLKRGASFSITITKPGYVGQQVTRKVKNYGHSKKELEKARRDPFNESSAAFPWAPRSPLRSAEAGQGDDQAVYEPVARRPGEALGARAQGDVAMERDPELGRGGERVGPPSRPRRCRRRRRRGGREGVDADQGVDGMGAGDGGGRGLPGALEERAVVRGLLGPEGHVGARGGEQACAGIVPAGGAQA